MGAQSQATPAGTVDPALLTRALSALLKHHESTSSTNQLLDDDLDIQVQFTLARIPGNPSVKPLRLDIPHPLVKLNNNDDSNNNNALEEASVCLIVKDESKPQIQQLLSRFPDELSHVKKILTLTSLRQKHKSYAQKRELLSRYDVFMADDRILPMLTKALGGKFFEKKRQPIPLNVCREEALPFAVERSLRGTFMCVGAGTCVTVRAGNTAMTPKSLAENISAIITQAPLKVPRKWSNIKSISIKTTNSVALPVYNKTLEELEGIKSMADVGVSTAHDGKKKMDEVKKKEEEEEKKRKEVLVAKSPLVKALKKQKSETNKDEDHAVVSKTPKSSKKRKDAETEEEEKEKVIKSAKKSKSNDNNIIKTPKSKEVKPSKSTTKKDKQTDSNSDATFIPSKKFTGSKHGYVYRKDKQGLGYYRDVKPVVDKVWLAKLQSGKAGGRKSMGGSVKKRRGGGRRSY